MAKGNFCVKVAILESRKLREELQTGVQQMMVSRNVTSWAVCLYFLEKVRSNTTLMACE